MAIIQESISFLIIDNVSKDEIMIIMSNPFFNPQFYIFIPLMHYSVSIVTNKTMPSRIIALGLVIFIGVLVFWNSITYETSYLNAFVVSLATTVLFTSIIFSRLFIDSWSSVITCIYDMHQRRPLLFVIIFGIAIVCLFFAFEERSFVENQGSPVAQNSASGSTASSSDDSLFYKRTTAENRIGAAAGAGLVAGFTAGYKWGFRPSTTASLAIGGGCLALGATAMVMQTTGTDAGTVQIGIDSIKSLIQPKSNTFKVRPVASYILNAPGADNATHAVNAVNYNAPNHTSPGAFVSQPSFSKDVGKNVTQSGVVLGVASSILQGIGKLIKKAFERSVIMFPLTLTLLTFREEIEDTLISYLSDRIHACFTGGLFPPQDLTFILQNVWAMIGVLNIVLLFLVINVSEMAIANTENNKNKRVNINSLRYVSYYIFYWAISSTFYSTLFAMKIDWDVIEVIQKSGLYDNITFFVGIDIYQFMVTYYYVNLIISLFSCVIFICMVILWFRTGYFCISDANKMISGESFENNINKFLEITVAISFFIVSCSVYFQSYYYIPLYYYYILIDYSIPSFIDYKL